MLTGRDHALSAPQIRMAMLDVLAGAGDATAVGDDDIVAGARWRVPLMNPNFVTAYAPAARREATLVGLVAQDCAGSLGQALAALADDAGSRTVFNDPTLAESVATLLAGTRQTALFGADLTAVVTGPPGPELAELLDSAADREVQGAASVWRFGPASVRRALDAGATADGLLAALTAAAQNSELPQPLVYLLRDVARRHGEVDVVDVACVVCAENPALLAEIAAHRRLTALKLRAVAPTVLVGAAPADQTLAALREAGYAPLPRAVDGSIAVRRPRHRARAGTAAVAAGVAGAGVAGASRRRARAGPAGARASATQEHLTPPGAAGFRPARTGPGAPGYPAWPQQRVHPRVPP